MHTCAKLTILALSLALSAPALAGDGDGLDNVIAEIGNRAYNPLIREMRENIGLHLPASQSSFLTAELPDEYKDGLYATARTIDTPISIGELLFEHHVYEQRWYDKAETTLEFVMELNGWSDYPPWALVMPGTKFSLLSPALASELGPQVSGDYPEQLIHAAATTATTQYQVTTWQGLQTYYSEAERAEVCIAAYEQLYQAASMIDALAATNQVAAEAQAPASNSKALGISDSAQLAELSAYGAVKLWSDDYNLTIGLAKALATAYGCETNRPLPVGNDLEVLNGWPEGNEQLIIPAGQPFTGLAYTMAKQ